MSAPDLEECRRWLTLPKWGEPCEEWAQDRSHRGKVVNAFGLVDREGAMIPGLQAEFVVFRPPRIVMEKFVFTLWQVDLGVFHRLYQLDINRRRGVRPGDHQHSHEHLGPMRTSAEPSWAQLDFGQAVERFLSTCHLTLSEPLPDPDALALK
jgi:hypothetical protein